MSQIKSKNSLFRGMKIEKPKRATLIYGPTGEAWYVCPHCKNSAIEDDHDVMGADPGALFCLNCSGEFEIPVGTPSLAKGAA